MRAFCLLLTTSLTCAACTANSTPEADDEAGDEGTGSTSTSSTSTSESGSGDDFGDSGSGDDFGDSGSDGPITSDDGSTGEPEDTDFPLPACPGVGGPPCTVSPGDHASATCEAGECPFVTDVEIDCNDDDLGQVGIHVAAGPDVTHLTTNSYPGTILLQAFGAQGQSVGDLPCYFGVGSASHGLELTRGSSERIHLVADTYNWDGNELGGVTMATLEGGQWSAEAVYHANHSNFVQGLDVDDSGTPHVWMQDIGGFQLAIRTGLGAWQYENAPVPALGSPRDWGLSNLGEPANVYLSGNGNEELSQVIAIISGQDVPLGDTGPTPTWVDLVRPTLLGATSPEIVAVSQSPEDLRVRWPGGEMPIPGSAAPPYQCPWTDCIANCHEQATGVGDRHFAAARTTDGALWIAWVETNYDFVRLGNDCGGLCECSYSFTDDVSTATLHVSRLDFDSLQVELALDLPIDPASGAPFQKLMDAHAFEDQLAIGLRMRDSPALRLIQLDTSGL